MWSRWVNCGEGHRLGAGGGGGGGRQTSERIVRTTGRTDAGCQGSVGKGKGKDKMIAEENGREGW